MNREEYISPIMVFRRMVVLCEEDAHSTKAESSDGEGEIDPDNPFGGLGAKASDSGFDGSGFSGSSWDD